MKKVLILIALIAVCLMTCDDETISGTTVSDSTAYVYVTSSGSKYHRSSCSTIKRSKHVRRLTKSQARAMGYTACKVCKP